MKARRPPIPLRELVMSLRGVSFGERRSLPASANAFCRRQRMDVRQAFPSRSADQLSKVWQLPASAARQPFGGAARAPSPHAAFPSGPFVFPTPTPNPALQRTTTLAVSSRRAALTSTGAVTACAPAMQPGTARAFASRRHAATRAPRSRSLSLGSLGASARSLTQEAQKTTFTT